LKPRFPVLEFVHRTDECTDSNTRSTSTWKCTQLVVQCFW